jgi:methylated-DNA-[protein]-cysteine S-methyltransferase
MERYAVIESPIGPVGLVASPTGLSHVYLMRGSVRQACGRLGRLFPYATNDPGLLPELQKRVELYLSGRPVCFDVPVDLASFSEFQRRVLRACSGIEYGRTVSYGQLAQQVGCPAGARAVGGALARNPVPLVIPCHRVVAGDGSLGGFSAEQGVGLKRFLLEMEAQSRTDYGDAFPRPS